MFFLYNINPRVLRDWFLSYDGRWMIIMVSFVRYTLAPVLLRCQMKEGKGMKGRGKTCFYRISEADFVHFIVFYKVVLLILSYFTKFIHSFYRNLKLFL